MQPGDDELLRHLEITDSAFASILALFSLALLQKSSDNGRVSHIILHRSDDGLVLQGPKMSAFAFDSEHINENHPSKNKIRIKTVVILISFSPLSLFLALLGLG
jgi:hypothetical protein